MEQKNRFLEEFQAKRKGFGWYVLGLVVILLFNISGQFPVAVFLGSKGNEGETILEILSHLDSNLGFALLLIPFVTAFIGLVFVLNKVNVQSLKSATTAREKIDFNRIVYAFLLWGSFLVVLTGLSYMFSPENHEVTFNFKSFAILFLVSLIFLPFQTSLEEYLFRGYLMQGLATMSKNRWFPLLSTSIIFGLMHSLNPEIEKMGNELLILYIGMGFFLGVITLMDEGLELALGVHLANNLITGLLVTADWTVFQTDSVLKDISEPDLMQDFIQFLILISLALFILSKKYNWKNWRKKLTSSF